MRNIGIGMTTCWAVVVSAAMAFGQPADGNGQQPSEPPQGSTDQGGSGRRPPHPLLAIFDSNHDGVISAEEIQKAIDLLKSLDRNQDGQITPEELPGPPQPPQNSQTGGQSGAKQSGQGGQVGGQSGSPQGQQNSQGGGQAGQVQGGQAGSGSGQSGPPQGGPPSQGSGQSGPPQGGQGSTLSGQFGSQSTTGKSTQQGSQSGKRNGSQTRNSSSNRTGTSGRTGSNSSSTGSQRGRNGKQKTSVSSPEQLMTQHDLNQDGKLTESELPQKLRGQLHMWDANGDGGLDRMELEKMMQEQGTSSGF